MRRRVRVEHDGWGVASRKLDDADTFLNLVVMAGPDPAIHANTGQVEIAWMLGSKAISDRRLVFDAKAKPWLCPSMTDGWRCVEQKMT